ncbi:MAG: hypothetical protein HY821_02470 [Acidobacteria bacterium]|nr:hypothetical protein [Acidobacteriota bacterium]
MFDASMYLTDAAMAAITEARVSDPECAWRAAQERVRRGRLTTDGKLAILAADHPARRVTKVGTNPIAMADRRDYLARVARVLSAGGIDGLMATMDLIEDLLILDSLIAARGGRKLTDGKVLISSLNRGGLAGTSWELDDPLTGATVASSAAWRLDGVKILLRIGDADAGSLKTMLMSAQAVNECNALGLPMFLEPLPVVKTESGWTVQKDPAALAKIAGVASALGDSSRMMWLKLPYAPRYELVARSTTLPILLLGGESAGDPAPFLRELGSALEAGPNVRGALVGRNVLYPGDEDPLAMGTAVGGIIHEGWAAETAVEKMAAVRGTDGNAVSRYF